MINTCVPKKFDSENAEAKNDNTCNNFESSDEEYDKYKAQEDNSHQVKWTLEKLRDHFIDENLDFDNQFDQICDIVAKTMIGVDGQFCDPVNRQSAHRTNCFELFGFDILVDKNIKPWLQEVILYIF